MTANLGCEVSTTEDQDKISGPKPFTLTVNSEAFFGPDDWTFAGKYNFPGKDPATSDGAYPPVPSGTSDDEAGEFAIAAAIWGVYGEVMAIFKSGKDTFLTGYLLKTGDTLFDYESPFSKEISHISIYGRGAPVPPSVVPLPAGGVLLIGALGGLALLRRRTA